MLAEHSRLLVLCFIVFVFSGHSADNILWPFLPVNDYTIAIDEGTGADIGGEFHLLVMWGYLITHCLTGINAKHADKLI